jgi:hypothetical protein
MTLVTPQEAGADCAPPRLQCVLTPRNRGAIWEQIGAALRVTRQASHERYARPRAPPPELWYHPALPEPSLSDATRRLPK